MTEVSDIRAAIEGIPDDLLLLAKIEVGLEQADSDGDELCRGVGFHKRICSLRYDIERHMSEVYSREAIQHAKRAAIKCLGSVYDYKRGIDR
jgi:hypothetical protein